MLSGAAHVRFSNGGGDPTVPDGTRDARGIAVKLYLEGASTDIIGITEFFVRTPEELIEFNVVRRPDPETGAPDMAKVGRSGRTSLKSCSGGDGRHHRTDPGELFSLTLPTAPGTGCSSSTVRRHRAPG